MLKAFARAIKSPSTVRAWRRISAAMVIVSLVIAGAAATYGASRPELSGSAAFGLFAGSLLLGILIAQAFFDLEGWLEQHGRDLIADRIWDQLQAGKTPDDRFILYLRPFASTDQIAQQEETLVAMRAQAGAPTFFAPASERLEFEGEIERALRPLGPLIALGKPLEHIGAGRILVPDAEWRDAVLTLVQAARLIVLLPSSRAGTIWEVEQILSSGALEKTIIVDPPNRAGAPNSEYDSAAEWDAVRATFQAYRYDLPDDDPKGLMLHFGDGLTPERTSRITFNGVGSVRKFATKVLDDIAASPPAQTASD